MNMSSVSMISSFAMLNFATGSNVAFLLAAEGVVVPFNFDVGVVRAGDEEEANVGEGVKARLKLLSRSSPNPDLVKSSHVDVLLGIAGRLIEGAGGVPVIVSWLFAICPTSSARASSSLALLAVRVRGIVSTLPSN
jgi:hypothetical protein